ncbi:uncharacterized protein F4822DRAFT_432446 [Hypoxylon trugodes]|uniref:uncharacterized protein n=1 Tax=Hypoxylon trugodes TaxID=326681 RepID=UPI00219D3285|nr:uncharacterized protein F4822DRAFT_432446 [Hypoxylon trugodes]KAI1385591.1 hypothetical protein F4822DRAFT_432446 [Hypoxylon trugodes]
MAFPQYQNVPNELKLAIWEEATMSPGMHHFKMCLTRVYDMLAPPLYMYQTVKIEPAKNTLHDSSAWRGRLNMSMSDLWACLSFLKLKYGRSTLRVCPAGKSKDLADKHATIDRDNDLVCLELTGDGTVLPPYIWPTGDQNDVLKKLRRIAIPYSTNANHQFHCECVMFLHRNYTHCGMTLSYLIGYFGHLEQFFFVVKLDKDNTYTTGSAPRFSKKNCDADTAAEWHQKRTTRALNRFRDIAVREELARFEDMRHTYYEVRESDTQDLAFFRQI